MSAINSRHIFVGGDDVTKADANTNIDNTSPTRMSPNTLLKSTAIYILVLIYSLKIGVTKNHWMNNNYHLGQVST